MTQVHTFHGRGDVESHLNEQHHYLPWEPGVGTAGLLAIHRELHLMERLDRQWNQEEIEFRAESGKRQ